MDKYSRLFQEDVNDILSDIEVLVLQLRDSPDSFQIIDLMKDSFRKIKKKVSMFGFDHIASFACDVEMIFDQVCKGKIPVTTKLLGLTIAARDNILEQLYNYSDILDHDSMWVALELQSLSNNSC